MTATSEIDEFTQWSSSKFKDPIEVAHGIKLNKAIAELGNNWWSRRWLSIIEDFGLGVRLQRAKMYASRGQVISIIIENGIVRGSVQGSDEEPYRVIIAIKTIPQPVWKSIIQDLGRSSQFGICLSSKTLPPEQEL